jgi:integrase
MSVKDPTVPLGTRMRVERGIWKRLTKSGWRYEVVVCENGRVTRRVVDGGLREARAVRGELLSRRARGERVFRPARLTFEEVVREWEESSTSHLRARTVDVYQLHLRRKPVKRWARRQVASLDVDDVAKLISELRREKLSARTIRGVLGAVSGPLNLAVRRGYIAANPVKGLSRHERPTIEREPKRVLSSAETEKILKTANARWKLIIGFALATGVRQGEQLGLRWGDLDLAAGVVHVRRQLDRDGTLSPLKTTAASRDIPLPASLVTRLKEHRLASGHSQDHELVFCTASGKPMSHRNVLRRLDSIVGQAKIAAPKPTWHNLRDTFVARLIRSGTDVYWVSRVAGHSNAGFTLSRYGGVLDGEEQASVAKAALEAALGRLIYKLKPAGGFARRLCCQARPSRKSLTSPLETAS